MRKALGWLWFLVVQILAFIAFVVGAVILIPLSAAKFWKYQPSKNFAPKQIAVWRSAIVDKIYGNDEDGVIGSPLYRERIPNEILSAYLWSAWRNSANNLRFVFRWKGGPFYRYEFKRWYFQCGWYPNGFPVLSAGRIQPVAA